MAVVDELTRLGGVATRAALIARTSRRQVDNALAGGQIVALARGRYAVPQIQADIAAAHRLSGAVCLLSAALRHGWAVKTPPKLPQIAVPRNRRLTPELAAGAEVRRLRLVTGDVVDGVTSRDRTIMDCLRLLPDDEALAVADSMLRDGGARSSLEALVRDARGPGTARMRLLVQRAHADAANPFESVLRAIGHRVPGLNLRPQVVIRRPDANIIGGGARLGRPDLVDEDLRIIAEADSFEWHGNRAALQADARRYNAFTVAGWLVLRFCWEDVMFNPDGVRGILAAAVAERTDQR